MVLGMFGFQSDPAEAFWARAHTGFLASTLLDTEGTDNFASILLGGRFACTSWTHLLQRTPLGPLNTIAIIKPIFLTNVGARLAVRKRSLNK